MVLHPEVQTRAQDEIDRIVGGGRLPDFSDRPQLPYCTALCKELQRQSLSFIHNLILTFGYTFQMESYRAEWHCPSNQRRRCICRLFHSGENYNSSESVVGFGPVEFTYATVLNMNFRAMLMDPKEHPDPHIFRPERYLPADGGRVQRDPYKIAFGFGRRWENQRAPFSVVFELHIIRVCPGRNFADNAVSLPIFTRHNYTKEHNSPRFFLVVVRILATFNISKSRDADGAAVDPVVNIKCEGVLR